MYLSPFRISAVVGGDVMLTWNPNVVGLTAGGGPGLNRTDRGDVTIYGSDGSYEDIVDFDAAGSAGLSSGYVDLLGTPGGFPNPLSDTTVEVLVDLVGTPEDISSLLATGVLGSDVGSGPMVVDTTSAEFIRLRNYYNAKFGGSFDAMLVYTTPAGTTSDSLDFSWNFSPSSGVTLDKIVAVPEPGAIGLVVAAGLMMGRRRRA